MTLQTMQKHNTANTKTGTKDFLRALQKTATLGGNPQRVLADAFDDVVEARRSAPALFSDAESYRCEELAKHSLRYARWGLEQDLVKGDVVALMMENRAEYVAVWLGLNRIGVVVALLNTNLAGEALKHCITVARPERIIASRAFIARCQAIFEIDHGPAILDASTLKDSLSTLSGDRLMLAPAARPTLSDHALYINTSGTTGLPKAAIVSHRRVIAWAAWFAGLADTGPTDRMYNCLPLYHSVGGIVAVWATLLGGGSVVLREKFSASSFWDDVVSHGCTLFQYIGELCRYLIKAPPCDAESKHQLRMAIGNGLRADVWLGFEARFHIPRIIEFYAATESNFSLYNIESEPGSLGRVPPFLAARQKLRIIKLGDDETPLRDANGFCVTCGVDEPGETIAQISAAGDAAEFEGYLDRVTSERKILRDVFASGDAWMRSGDLMRKDARGFFYFVDRIGDTFRWKGENVATAEVEGAFAAIAGVIDVAAYGVAAPGYDGRAGMAALVVDDRFDMSTLRAQIESRLPAYARPLFLRVSNRIEMTDTFRHKKRGLSEQGYDFRNFNEPVYFATPQTQTYQRMDLALLEELRTNAIRL